MKVFFSIILTLTVSLVYSQDKLLKEIVSFYDNGKPKNINYKNQSLKLVKTQEIDLDGEVISEYNYNTTNGKRNGDFYNLLTKGYYDNGVLNSESYIENIESNDSNTEGIFWKGKVKNGRPVGKVEVYKLDEDFEVTRRLNVGISTQMSMSVGYKLRYYDNKYKSKGTFTKSHLTTLFYNENGNLNGIQKINNKTELYYVNGKLKGYVIKNNGLNNISRDSVFRENEIWKINNVFRKNNGFSPKVLWNEFKPHKIQFNGSMFFGSEKSIKDEYSKINSYGGESIYFMTEDFSPSLNSSGMYYKSIILPHEGGYHERQFIDSKDFISPMKIIPSEERNSGLIIYNIPFVSKNLTQDIRFTYELKNFEIEKLENVSVKTELKKFNDLIESNYYSFNEDNIDLYINGLKNLVQNKYINLSEIWIFRDGQFVDYFEINKSLMREKEILLEKERKLKESKEYLEELKKQEEIKKEEIRKEEIKKEKEKRLINLRKIFDSRTTLNSIKLKNVNGRLSFKTKFPDFINIKSTIQNGTIEYEFDDEFGHFKISITLVDRRNYPVYILSKYKFNPGFSSTQTEEGLKINSIWKGTELSSYDINKGDIVNRINGISMIYPLEFDLKNLLSKKNELILDIKTKKGDNEKIKIYPVINYSGKKNGEYSGEYQIRSDGNGLLYSIVFGDEKKQPELKILYQPKNPNYSFDFESDYLYRFSYFLQDLIYF